MTLYKGSQQIRDTGSYGVYKGSTPIGAIYKGSQKVYQFHRELTFNPSSGLQTYKVPSWVSKIHVDCVASSGYNSTDSNGKGGRVQCDLPVTGGQTLYIMVGGQPSSNAVQYNASDIRTNNAGVTNTTSLQSRLLVAGGGGTRSNWGGSRGVGGNGGGLTGSAGATGDGAGGGQGGTQSAGGAGGYTSAWGQSGSAGTLGLGGRGADGQGGAGGAGYYGGGGGGDYSYYGYTGSGGGGGGSSYTNNQCTNVSHTQGYRNGAGYITITEID